MGRRSPSSSPADPKVAWVLWLLAAAAIVAIVASVVAEDKEIREVGLAAIGGSLLLIGAYFTARNLHQSNQSSFVANLLQAAESLADDDPVRHEAGRQALEYMKAQHPSGKKDDQARSEAAGRVLEEAETAPSGTAVAQSRSSGAMVSPESRSCSQ